MYCYWQMVLVEFPYCSISGLIKQLNDFYELICEILIF
jgi:hypothetical protein